MNRHYDRYLSVKYAPLYRDRHGSVDRTAMCWGFEVGDGWFNLINHLSKQICYDWLHAVAKYNAVKDGVGKLYNNHVYGGDGPESKFNYLITPDTIADRLDKIAIEEVKVPRAVQVKEKFGGLRFYVDGASERHQTLIQFAENMSYTICETCGKPGKPTTGGWITTLCKEHRIERLNRMREEDELFGDN